MKSATTVALLTKSGRAKNVHHNKQPVVKICETLTVHAVLKLHVALRLDVALKDYI